MYIILFFVIFLICIYLYKYSDSKEIVSNFDNKRYVVRKGGKMLDAANKLAEINNLIESLIKSIEKKYPNELFVKKLKENYNHTVLSEAPIDDRLTTYTIDKKDIYVCLKTRNDKEEIYDTNTLIYVLLHELAHLSNYSINNEPIIGHGKEFQKIFKILVKEAIEIKIYKYIDYSSYPQEYCGLYISTQIYKQ